MPGDEGARAEVLDRIRTALSTEAGAPAGIPRGYRTGAGLAAPALIELLAERLHDYGTSVRRCPAGGAAQAVREALAERGARRVVLPPGLSLDGAGLDGADLDGIGVDGAGVDGAGVDGAGLDGAARDGITFLTDDGLSPETLDATDGVITTAALAIAETGTIILDGGPGQGRRALSLVPDYHLCILHASQVVGIVPQALARLEPGRPCTWISGPSATSDIELDRVQGVHGPRTLEVILVGA
jgi:L-lactate dehydrogenase complex protein LldG